jgi:hypothetical protein
MHDWPTALAGGCLAASLTLVLILILNAHINRAPKERVPRPDALGTYYVPQLQPPQR